MNISPQASPQPLDLGEGGLSHAPAEPPESEGIPIYRRVANALRARLRAGEWKPGDAMPTEVQLAQIFSASPGTIKKALQLLVNEKRVERRQGKGTFVPRFNVEGDLAMFFRRFVDENGAEYNAMTKLMTSEVVPAPAQIAQHLRIDEGQPVVALERLRLVHRTPLMIEHSYLPQRLFPGLESEDLSARLLYQVMEEQYGYPVSAADEYVRPDIASAEDAKVLGIRMNSPVIVIERLVRSGAGRVVEYRRCVGRGDKYRLHVRLR